MEAFFADTFFQRLILAMKDAKARDRDVREGLVGGRGSYMDDGHFDCEDEDEDEAEGGDAGEAEDEGASPKN